ncbi:hypothetical protein B277_15872 [Janibacter hoylei PVAS-1]|uniref:Uncharacterized protein n=1 Tax=Janibacter hoylei PVAS-1 TaxID=1210046 RepID=K1EKL8_9MICO|nr:hypothetical protein [Janibacter hoylei]EKA59873.1 hypothetical protein B277_15872 [Janibacter hoylei PVAS-1]
MLDHVAGRLGTPEWSFEVAMPGPTLERHRWPAHPRCPECGDEVMPADEAEPTLGVVGSGERPEAGDATTTPPTSGSSTRPARDDTMAG